MPIDRARIDANGWVQGRFFTPEDSTRLLAQYGQRIVDRVGQRMTALILASHVCDVLSYADDDEPDVTVYPALELAANTQFAPSSVRRPRVWHFEMTRGGETLRRELQAPTAFQIPRMELEMLRPCATTVLSGRYGRQFSVWLGIRWNRPAFPDEFNRRLLEVHQQIRREVQRVELLIRALLIDLDPRGEIPANESVPYEIELYALIEHADFEDVRKRQDVQRVVDQIATLMRERLLADGSPAFVITAGKCAVRSMAAMSVAEYNDYLSFGFEELSLRNETSELPPDSV